MINKEPQQEAEMPEEQNPFKLERKRLLATATVVLLAIFAFRPGGERAPVNLEADLDAVAVVHIPAGTPLDEIMEKAEIVSLLHPLPQGDEHLVIRHCDTPVEGPCYYTYVQPDE